MANYYVDSAAAGTNTGGSWTNAFLTLVQATAVATNADTIYVDDGHSESQTTAMTITCPSTFGLKILSVDKALGLTPNAVSAGATVAIGAGSVAMTIAGCVYVYGVSFLGATNGNANADINVAVGAVPEVQIFEACNLQTRGSIAGARLVFGNTGNASNDERLIVLTNTSIGAGHVDASILVRNARVRGVGVSLVGTTLTSLFETNVGTTADLEFIGCNLAGYAWTNLLATVASATGDFKFSQCSFGGSNLLLNTGTAAGGAEVYVFDCAVGDVHGIFGYANVLGSVVSDTGIFFTSGAAAQSWKIVTTANCSFFNPFVTPWFGYYNTTTTAITPYVEILRDGSATAYNDNQVWLDVMAKTNTGSTQSALTTDRMTLLGSANPQDNGAGLGSWTGESGTAWSGKLQVASLTPAEVGRLSARVVVGEPSITVYADPQIRT